MHTNTVARRKAPGYPILETYKYIPYIASSTMKKSDSIRSYSQIILENIPMLRVKAVEVHTDTKIKPLLPLFELALGDLPLVTSDLMVLTAQDLNLGKIHVEDGKLSTQTNCLMVVSKNCFAHHDFVEGAVKSLHERGYLVSRESPQLTASEAIQKCPPEFNIVSMIQTDDNEQLVLLQRQIKRKLIAAQDVVVNISNSGDTTTADSYEWLDKLKTAIKQSKGNVIVLSQNNPRSGIVGLVNCIRKEPEGNKVICVFIDDAHAPPFDLQLPFYQEQLKLGLAVNVLRNVRALKNMKILSSLNSQKKTFFRELGVAYVIWSSVKIFNRSHATIIAMQMPCNVVIYRQCHGLKVPLKPVKKMMLSMFNTHQLISVM